MDRRTLTLRTAEKLITIDRAQQYGSAVDSFTRIADLWSAYLSYKIHPSDVANMMSLLKISRARGTPLSQDSYDDACGYSALAAELAIGELTDEEQSKI